jgi:hypothetical protein
MVGAFFRWFGIGGRVGHRQHGLPRLIMTQGATKSESRIEAPKVKQRHIQSNDYSTHSIQRLFHPNIKSHKQKQSTTKSAQREKTHKQKHKKILKNKQTKSKHRITNESHQ